MAYMFGKILKHIFEETSFINIQKNILPRMMEWLKDATNVLEKDDSLLDKGLNNSFLNYNRCLFS